MDRLTSKHTNTLGQPIAPTVFPHGPQWDGHITPYTPAYNTPHGPGEVPPPDNLGTMKRPTTFPVEPAPKPAQKFGTTVTLTFELRKNSAKNAKGPSVTVVGDNSSPLSKLIDAAIYKAMADGLTNSFSRRILAVFGPSGKQLDTGFGYTLKDQSPPVPNGSNIVLVFQD